MQFDKIRFDGSNVELDHREELPEGGNRDVTDTGKDPSPAFKAALQSFASYVAWVHSWPESFVERIDVRGVSIKRPDDAPRGINVTALLKCARARNSTSTVNTPYLSEPPEGYNGDRSGFLPATTVTLIDDLEARASEYLDGERGEQTTLALGNTSENLAAVNDRMASAEVASTRKPKGKGKNGKKGRDFVPGVGAVVNAESTEPLSDDALRQLLLSVDRDVPIDAIAVLTSSDRDAAQRWAEARLKEMVGQLAADTVPTEPECVVKLATLPLKADNWTQAPPRAKLDDDGIRSIQSARTVQ